MMILRCFQSSLNESARSKTAMRVQDSLYVTADFHTSGVFMLSDCILLNHWFINLIGLMVHNKFFMWLQSLSVKSNNSLNYIYVTVYIWFVTKHRKPPDKTFCLPTIQKCLNSVYEIIFIIEDAADYLFNFEIDICFWTSLLWYHFQRVCRRNHRYHTPQAQAHKYLHERKVSHVFKSVLAEPIERHFGRTLHSNVVLSYAAQTKNQDYVDDFNTLDVDSYQFVIDTGTTFHVCKH